MVQKTIEPQKARQGRRGWQVLTVLIVSLFLVMIGWYVVEGYNSAALEPDTPAASDTSN